MYGTVSYLPHGLAWDMYRNSVVQVKALQDLFFFYQNITSTI